MKQCSSFYVSYYGTCGFEFEWSLGRLLVVQYLKMQDRVITEFSWNQVNSTLPRREDGPNRCPSVSLFYVNPPIPALATLFAVQVCMIEC